MALENGIAELVQEFVAAGRPSAREQNIDDRRAGYIASTVLAGVTETRVHIETVKLEGLLFRVYGFFQLGGVSQAARDVMRDLAWRVSSPGREDYSSSFPPSS